jgi:hypothetical protein
MSVDGATSVGAIHNQHWMMYQSTTAAYTKPPRRYPNTRDALRWDPTIPVNIIIATDGSVTLGVGYHSWIVATEDEDIIL